MTRMKTVVNRKDPTLPVTECMAYELTVVQFVTALADQCETLEGRVKDRLHTIKNGWRDWRLMRSLLRKMSDNLLDTMPDKEIIYLNKMLEHGEIFMRLRPPIRDTEYQLVENAVITRIVNKIMQDECAICFREGRDIKHCQLRKDLHMIVPCADKYDPMVECVYRNAVLNGERGKYVSE